MINFMLNRATGSRKNKFFAALAGFFLVLLISGIVFAAQPQTIALSGRLSDASGVVLSGNYNFTFNIYNVQTGGAAMWTEIHDGRANAAKVNSKNGLWTTTVGGQTPLSLTWNETYYLELIVDGELLAPRVAFSSVPYTLNASTPADFNFTGTNRFQGGNTFYGGSTFYGPIHILNSSNIVNFTMTANNVSGGTFGNTLLHSSIATLNGTNVFSTTNTYNGTVNFNSTLHVLGGTLVNISLSGNNITAGTIGNARLDTRLAWINASNVFSTTNTFNGSIAFNSTLHVLGGTLVNISLSGNNITAGTIGNARLDTRVYFVNDSLTASNITGGTLGNARLDTRVYFVNDSLTASNITGGTLGNARLDTSLAWINASNVFSTTNTYNGTVNFNSTLHVLGGTLVNISLSGNNITAGTIGNARLDTRVYFVNDSLTASNITGGTLGNARLDTRVYFVNDSLTASNITGGTLGNARLDTSLAWINASQVFSTTNTFNGTTTFNNTVHFLGTTNFVNMSLTPNNITNTSANSVFADNLIGFYDALSASKTGGMILQASRTTADSTCSGGNVDNTTVTLGKPFSSPLSYYVVAQELNISADGLVVPWVTVVKNDSRSFNLSCISAVALTGASATSPVDWIAIGT